MKLIDKDAVLAEIEKLMYGFNLEADIASTGECFNEELADAKYQLCKLILSFINALEVKEVDLEKELIKWHKEHFKKDGTFIGMSGFYLTNNSQMDIAKHFFELGVRVQKEEKYEVPSVSKTEDISVTSRMAMIDNDLKPIAEFILDYAHWNLHKDEWNHPVLEVPLFRVLDALIQKGKPYCGKN